MKELKAPAGFVSSDEVLNLNASYQGQDVKMCIRDRCAAGLSGISR